MEQLDKLAPQLAGAVAAVEPLVARAAQTRQLADLVNANGTTNQYKMTLSSFVLAARLEEVAAAASQRLLRMTAGRYSLAHTDSGKGARRPASGCWPATRGPGRTGTPRRCRAARRSWPASRSRSASPT